MFTPGDSSGVKKMKGVVYRKELKTTPINHLIVGKSSKQIRRNNLFCLNIRIKKIIKREAGDMNFHHFAIQQLSELLKIGLFLC